MTQDFFATASFAVVATETYTRGLKRLLEEDLGIPCNFSFARKPGVKPDNDAVRAALKAQTAAGAVRLVQRTHVRCRTRRPRHLFIPASFPGAIIRRATGTPFMGYAGATYVVQEYCNALFDALFHILPLGTEMDKIEATPCARPPPRMGPPRRIELLDRHMSMTEPYMVRISAAKRSARPCRTPRPRSRGLRGHRNACRHLPGSQAARMNTPLRAPRRLRCNISKSVLASPERRSRRAGLCARSLP